MQPVNLEKYRQLYLVTAQQYLQTFSASLDAYVNNKTVQASIDQMFISIHSIKSQSFVMGYAELGNFCKEVEMKLRDIREGRSQLTQETIQYFQQAQQKISAGLQAIQATDTPTPSSAVVSPAPLQTQGKRILLIEDDNFFESFYAMKLREVGFTIDVAKNGEEGMQLMQQNTPQLVLLDLIMPVKDGFRVLEEKKNIPAIAQIPVIVFSTLGQEQDIQKATALGANDYVNKSFFDFQVLLSKIESYL